MIWLAFSSKFFSIVRSEFTERKIHYQSILHFGIGLGGSGGIETSPYSDTGSLLGVNIYGEYEIYVQDKQSISFRSKYSRYEKNYGLLDVVDANSSALYLGLSYNLTNAKISEKNINELSPIIAYGFEQVRWYNEYTSLWSGNSQVLDGNDYAEYVTFGLSGAIGLKKNDLAYKVRLSVYYDHILYTKRTIIEDTGDILEDPNYKTDLNIQLEFLIGLIRGYY